MNKQQLPSGTCSKSEIQIFISLSGSNNNYIGIYLVSYSGHVPSMWSGYAATWPGYAASIVC